MEGGQDLYTGFDMERERLLVDESKALQEFLIEGDSEAGAGEFRLQLNPEEFRGSNKRKRQRLSIAETTGEKNVMRSGVLPFRI